MSRVLWGSMLTAISLIFLAAPAFAGDSPARVSVSSQSAVDTDCSTCHEKQVKSLADKTMHASAHARAGVDKCTACHNETALKRSHTKVTPGEIGFVKSRRYPPEFCLVCHGTYADLAKHTVDSKTLTDKKGRVINPHDIPRTPKHGRVAECANCHREHKTNPDIIRYCSGCHHTGEFTCTGCHS